MSADKGLSCPVKKHGPGESRRPWLFSPLGPSLERPPSWPDSISPGPQHRFTAAPSCRPPKPPLMASDIRSPSMARGLPAPTWGARQAHGALPGTCCAHVGPGTWTFGSSSSQRLLAYGSAQQASFPQKLGNLHAHCWAVLGDTAASVGLFPILLLQMLSN